MTRLQTTQGNLARRGFADSATAERIVTQWDVTYEPLLDLVTHSADPDLALSGLDRLATRSRGWRTG